MVDINDDYNNGDNNLDPINDEVVNLDKNVPLSSKKKLLYGVIGSIFVMLIAFNVYAHYKYDIPGLDIGHDGQTATTPSTTDPDAKYLAPELQFKDYNGNIYQLNDFNGKPTMVNVWATWCSYCLEEMPLFNAAAAKYKDEINFIMVNYVDSAGKETIGKAKNYIDSSGFDNLTFVYDDTDDIRLKLGFSGLPYNLFIYPDGIILAAFSGAVTQELLDEAIEWLLEYQPE